MILLAALNAKVNTTTMSKVRVMVWNAEDRGAQMNANCRIFETRSETTS